MKDSEDPDLVNLLYAQAPVAILGGFGSAILFVLVISDYLDPIQLEIWLVGLLAVTLWRYRLVQAYDRRVADPRTAPTWARRYVVGTLASGVIWGWAGILLLGTQSIELQVLTAFLSGGMVAGAVVTHVPNRAAFYAFVLPTLLPLPPLFVLEGSRLHWVMAVGTLFFLILMTYSANRFHGGLRRSLELAREKEAMSHQMSDALARLEESEAQYRTLFELNPLMYFTLDAFGNIQSVNELGASQLGYRVEELTGQPVTRVFPDNAHLRVRAQLDRCLQELNRVHAWEGEKVRKDGSHLTVRETGVAIQRHQGLPLILIICEDITEYKKAEGRIHQLAYYDPLTNLPNRRLFMDRLAQARSASKRNGEYAALMILDLDNFKILNDTQGHDVGDRLLIETAQRIKSNVRVEDSVGRLGGDEYVVLIENLGADAALAASLVETLADRLLSAIREPYCLPDQGHTYHSGTTSIGVTLFRGDETTPDALLKQADLALYRAKDAGRNGFRFFDPLMQAGIEERMAMETALREGIDLGELRLFLQPQVDREGKLRGADALVRWLQPDQEPLTASQFIPLAEQSGLILPIGHWMLAEACAQLKAWEMSPSKCDLQLTVHISARQFYHPDFVDQVRAALASVGADPGHLVLELTESLLLNSSGDLIERMHALKALGVGLSLDDFCTGYSSLSCLKRLPLDWVKIDQPFVRNIPQEPDDLAIVRAILAMTQSLGLQTIADGVENAAQRDFLFENGCTVLQGRLFGEPMTAEEWQIRQVVPESQYAGQHV